jgi:SAM-dependent methyltransferase
MTTLAKCRNVVLTRLKAWGSSRLQRFAWNREFAEGHWDFIDSTPDDCIYGFLARYSNRGAILDLGCGAGNTGGELEENCYTEYLGVDISDVAVEKARTRAAQSGRAGKNTYVQGDVVKFKPDKNFDVILFRESIWYIPKRKLLRVIARYRKHLKTGGAFIVRIYDRHLRGDIVDLLRTGVDVIEERALSDERDIVLVFR